ncbi:Protein of unknown function [Lactobacillus helveticus CIRM-BIA 101]|nr:Protein of unknown function [Lactobacillus helveticus CIRM-BIA 104]CDI63754.1 Protein of unknown function [Lactobacillus helveticus CIRM-BIA 103]CDI65170.1 Protein of unknown function [Lactobacillus helveticus CIRM-BIA 101]
MIFLRK